MSVEAHLTLIGVDLTQPSPADLEVSFTKIEDEHANLVKMSLTLVDDTIVEVQFTTEDLQELGRKLTLMVP